MGLAAAGACAAVPALDLVGVKPPQELVDREVTIGGRTLQLPPGHWVYVDHSEEIITGGPQDHYRTVVDTVFLLQVEDRTLVSSVRLALVRGDFWRPRWDYPCLRANRLTIYRQDRESPPGSTDCLFVGGRLESSFGKWLEGYSAAATNWLTQMGTRLPGTTISAGYLRFSANTFGTVWVLAPAEDFDSDAAAIAWAESLRTAMKPMFEHRSNAARMPPLPAPGAAASAASSP